MQTTITSIDYYNCGYCTNNLKLVFKGHPSEKRQFAAGVFLLRHPKHGYILFDTGYTTDIYHCGLIGKLYNLFNPAVVRREDMIDRQLMVDDIDPRDIRYIILSHLHPDHIGGLSAFLNAKIIISYKACERILKPHMRDLFIRQFFTVYDERNLMILTEQQLNSTQLRYFRAYDLFGDGSVMITNMDGHAYGQICALVNGKMLLAADTCWGNDLIEKMSSMRWIASKIQDNFADYLETGRVLEQLRESGIELLFSHDKYERKHLL